MTQHDLDLEESTDELHFFLIKAVAANDDDSISLSEYYGSGKQLVPVHAINSVLLAVEDKFKKEYFTAPEFIEVMGVYYLGHGTYRDFNTSPTH